MAKVGSYAIAATPIRASNKFSLENSTVAPGFKQTPLKQPLTLQNPSESSENPSPSPLAEAPSPEPQEEPLELSKVSAAQKETALRLLSRFKRDRTKHQNPARTPTPTRATSNILASQAQPDRTQAHGAGFLPEDFKQNSLKLQPQGNLAQNLLGQNSQVQWVKPDASEKSTLSALPQQPKQSPIKVWSDLVQADPVAQSPASSSTVIETATPADSLAVPQVSPPVNSAGAAPLPGPTIENTENPNTPGNSQNTPQNPPKPNLDFLYPLTPEQISQVAEPVLQIPDLTPPTDPFPPPTPNGTLETDPPAIVLPSSNLLYFPTEADQVEIQETVPLTLAQSLDLALRNNENLRVFELQVEQALAQLRQVQADLYPTLSFSSSLARTESANTTIATRASNRRVRTVNRQNQLINELQNQERGAANPPLPPLPLPEPINTSIPFGIVTFDNALQLSYDFGIDGRRSARIRTQEARLRSNELEFEQQAEQLRLDVTEAYYNLQEADANVAIQEAAVRNAQRSLEDAEALERAGVGTRFEVLQARVTLANAQQNLTNAISLQRRRRRELATLLNVSQNVNLITADAIALAGSWDITLENTILLAYRNRAELEQELLNREIAEAQEDEALGAQRPNLTASARYNVLGQLSDDASPFANQGWADGYSLQLQFTWNFFDGGAAKALGRQQELGIAIAEERFSQLRNQVRLEVESAFYDLQANFENIGVADLGVEEATEALRLARLRFQAGVGTQLDVINQETALTRAQNQLLQAIIGYNRALSSLQRAVSNLPGSNLQDLP